MPCTTSGTRRPRETPNSLPACGFRRSYPEVPIEAVTWRICTHSTREAFDLWDAGDTATWSRPGPKGSRPVYLTPLKQYRDVPIYDRESLRIGEWQTGPAVVEERESTAVLGPDCRFTIDAQMNLTVELA